MSITLLELYNEVASQPWSMFDNDATSTDDFDSSLISSINKALSEIWCSYPFDFRNRKKCIILRPFLNKYNLPNGIINQTSTDGDIVYCVKLNGKALDFIENPDNLPREVGVPNAFFIKDNKIGFSPAPDDTYKVEIEYSTFVVGKDKENKDIYSLREDSDEIDIPQKYKQLFLNALVSKSMMYALSSPSDENYAGYALQYEKAYKLLIKSVGGRRKSRKIVF